MGGGGKSGAEPIYRPQYTPMLENVQAAFGLGSLLAANPNMRDFLLTNPESRKALAKLGIGVDQLTGAVSSTPSSGRQMPSIGRTPSSGTYNRTISLFDKPSSQTANTIGLDQLAKLAPNIPSIDYNKMQSYITQGKLPTGQTIPRYTAPTPFTFTTPSYTATTPTVGKPFQFTAPTYQPTAYKEFEFTTPQIQNVPAQAYGGVLQSGQEQIQQATQSAANQLSKQFASRGLGRSGLLAGAATTLGRSAQEQAASLARDIGLQQALSELDVAKTMGAWEMARQQAQAAQRQFGATFGEDQARYQAGLQQWQQMQQAAENLARQGYALEAARIGEQARQFKAGLEQWRQERQAQQGINEGQLGLQAQEALTNIGLRQLGALGSLQEQAAAQAMRPYTMLSQLYGMNIGIPVPASGGKGDPFSAMLGATGPILSGIGTIIK